MLATIFSIYFFTISVFPCSDICEELGLINEIHSEQASNTLDDNCSTMCICNCCGIIFTNENAIVEFIVPRFEPTQLRVTTNNPLSDFRFTVWHPPKQA